MLSSIYNFLFFIKLFFNAVKKISNFIYKNNLIKELEELSQEMGIDSSIVQASGGNTSIKINNVIFVKASGKKLSNATKENIFLPLDMNYILDSFKKKIIEEDDFKFKILIKTDLKPSIETVFHAIIPYKIVLHSHPIDIISIAINNNAKTLLSNLLGDFDWDFIPYARPGYPVAKLIYKSLRKKKSNILILENHGLIIGADSINEARQLQKKVLKVFNLSTREIQLPDIKKIEYIRNLIPNSKLPKYSEIHSLGSDDDFLKLVRKNPVYPDHIVFCGKRPFFLDPKCINLNSLKNLEYLIIPKIGVLILRKESTILEIMLKTQVQIFSRIKDFNAIKFLSDIQCSELINWEAEKYRKKNINY